MDGTGLPISIITSSVSQHDSTKFIDVIKPISDFIDNDIIKESVAAYADKGYDSTAIRNYLKNKNNIKDCIPFRKNNKSSENKSYKKYNSIRCRMILWMVEKWIS